ncbi:MAG: hypothetical protein ACUZ8H_02235, partial [Candidatus Anammoxibacter sp.]
MYGKIFDSIYDGTLAEDWRALITFQQFIVLCDADGMIDMTPQSISRRTGIPIEHIIAGIEVLEKNDKYSRTPDEDGKRIELIDSHRPWGWHIINHEKYKNLRDADMIRAQTRERVRRHREKKRAVTHGNAKKRHTDKETNTDINTINQKKASPFVLPDNIDKETWSAFVEHRQKLKAPMTDKAKTLMINKLEKLNGSANDILNQSIENGWKGIFELKENDNGSHKQT